MLRKLNPTVITCLIFLIAASSATAAFNNYSMLFDGVDEYINCGGDNSLILSNEITISAWINRNSISGDQLIVVRGSPDAIKCNYCFYFRNNSLAFGYGDTNSAWQIWVTTNTFTDIVNWHHVCARFIFGIGTSIKIYYDNIEYSGSEGYWWLGDGNSMPYTAGLTSYIGQKPDSFPYYFNGNIDEVSIWNKALSSNEVSEIYNNGYPGSLVNHSAQTNLVSWWRMGDGGTWNGTNWTIPDQKGTNTGTSVNMEEADRSQEVPPAPPPPSGTTFMMR